MDFAPELVKVLLWPRPDYVPTVASNPFCFQLSPCNMGLCLVRTLRTYVDRTAQWRGSDQLFMCFGGKSKGFAVTKQQMSYWIVEAISLAYEAHGLTSHLGLRAHYTRAVASSQAFLKGSSMEDVCAVAGWSSPSTFIKFYSLDVRTAPGSQVLSAWGNAFLGLQLYKVRQALWYSVPKAMTSSRHLSEPRKGNISVSYVIMVPRAGNEMLRWRPSFGNLMKQRMARIYSSRYECLGGSAKRYLANELVWWYKGFRHSSHQGVFPKRWHHRSISYPTRGTMVT